MRCNLFDLLALVVCLLASSCPACSEEVRGVVTDPSGRTVAGAVVVLRDFATGKQFTTHSGGDGRYSVDLPAGKYQIEVTLSGFEPWIEDVAVEAGKSASVEARLIISPRRESVNVAGEANEVPLAGSQEEVSDTDRTQRRNSAQLLADLPGVSLRQNGELASMPLVHGLGDERAKVVVDGATISNVCANHMNPPLSYINPWNVANAQVIAGITPVSLGGDSLGGTVRVDSPAPAFAGTDQGWRTGGIISSFYRSNGDNYGPSLFAWADNNKYSVSYAGSWSNGDDYADGSGHRVTSTYAQSTDSEVTAALRDSGNLFVLQAGLHHTPYQGFTNAQMDMVRNYAESLNLRYQRALHQGTLEARVYWQGTWHSMNLGYDKSTFPMPMWMPMNTHGRDFGYSIATGIPIGEHHNLRVGTEFHRFILDDNWPPVPGTEPYMGPDAFQSINDGRRVRLAWYGEIASNWSSKWSTLLGIRNDTVWMNTGQISGYSDMYSMDADVFNAVSHARTDVNLDATATARYQASESMAVELGYARKTRSPNLYERYAWSTNWMTSGMIGWFGDGNYYVGNLNLQPEVGNTASATVSWQGSAVRPWRIQVTPYLTYIQDYIDVDTLNTITYGESTFAQLRFANHDARIYGADGTGKITLWDSTGFGQGEFTAVLGYLRGERLDQDTGLYQMMPLNVRFGLQERLKEWTMGIQLQAVDRKSDFDPRRYEQPTPGYALLGAHLDYQHERVGVIAGCDNLLNRYYELPLGGVNFDDFMASGWMSQIKPLTGRGRSVYLGISFRY
jgi:iron complex outermembrane receptor protein